MSQIANAAALGDLGWDFFNTIGRKQTLDECREWMATRRSQERPTNFMAGREVNAAPPGDGGKSCGSFRVASSLAEPQ